MLSTLKRLKGKTPKEKLAKVDKKYIYIKNYSYSDSSTLLYIAEHGLNVDDIFYIEIEKLYHILKNFDVKKISKEDSVIAIDCGGAEITIKDDMMYDTSNIDKIPDIIEVSHQIINKSDLRECERFVSDDELRPSMMGIYFNKNEMCATDGHILKWSNMKSFIEEEVIIPKRIYNLMNEESYNISKTDNSEFTGLKGGKEIIIFERINEDFPNYKSIFRNKDDFNYEITISKSDIMKEMRFVKNISYLNYAIFIRFGDKISVLSLGDDEYSNEYEYKSKKIGKFEGEYSPVMFNSQYMIDILKSINKEEIRIKIKGENDHLVINENNILMPVTIGDYQRGLINKYIGVETL